MQPMMFRTEMVIGACQEFAGCISLCLRRSLFLRYSCFDLAPRALDFGGFLVLANRLLPLIVTWLGSYSDMRVSFRKVTYHFEGKY